MTHRKKQSKLEMSLRLNIALIIAFCLLMGWSIVLVKDKLLLNANEMGTYLAESYASEEEYRLSSYESFMELGATYINEQIDESTDHATVQEWMKTYAENVMAIAGESSIDPYAVIEGEIVAAYPWEGDDSYDYAATAWYQNAIAADGNIVYTNAYQDAITGKELVTISVKLHGDGNVLAYDIILDKFDEHHSRTNMPEGSSYFLLDGNNELLYVDSDINLDDGNARAYLANLFSGIEEGDFENHSATVEDSNGVNRGVYYYRMDNGWLSIITIPIDNILQEGWDLMILALAFICVALIATLIVLTVREYLKGIRMAHTEDTLKLLGDTFYAIYRVNLAKGTYETIKSSEDVRETLGSKGRYSDLLKTIEAFVEKRTFDALGESFSIDNIRKLINEQVREFGGEYQRRFGNTVKWVNLKFVCNEALGLDEVILCFQEIDDEKRRRLQQNTLLENALNSAKQTAQRKTAFFSNVSHDMRTPLNAIIGLAELARKNANDPEKCLDYATKIERSGQQLLTLVNDILDMSRIEQGENSALNYAPMDLKECVEECAALFNEQARTEGKTILVTADAGPFTVYCDSFRVNQIMNNLISNAIKYSMAGSSVSIDLKTVSHAPKLRKYQIVVQDTGIGMSREFLDRIFEPFSRETMFAPANVTGTGLGMPIVKSLVQQMSGEISVESELGEGSAFTITLPLQPAEAEIIPTEKKPAEELDLTGKTILVAEDNEINLEIALEYLDMMGAEALSAENGERAVEVFESLEPGSIDAILMDMQMPVMDGCEACERIRALDRPDARSVPIIAVTANAFAEDIARTTQAGMNGHVAKPIDFAALQEALRSLL